MQGQGQLEDRGIKDGNKGQLDNGDVGQDEHEYDDKKEIERREDDKEEYKYEYEYEAKDSYSFCVS